MITGLPLPRVAQPFLVLLALFTLAAGVLLCTAVTPVAADIGGNWWQGFSPESLDGPVHCLAEWNGALVIGGEFEQVLGQPLRYLAIWDGQQWSAPPDGPEGPVYALSVHDAELIVGGSFMNCGGDFMFNVAAWNGTAWRDLHIGLFSPVHALMSGDDGLYAGGEFTSSASGAANHVARWNGEEWSALGAGCDDTVKALCEWDGQIFVGGCFMNAGGEAALGLALWDGAAWSAPGGGVSGEVHALLTHEGTVIAGGTFESAGALTTANIARWDGSEWSPLGAGLDAFVGEARVDCLLGLGGYLYAGGYFREAPPWEMHMLARWDGEAWDEFFNPSMNERVRAILPLQDALVAGGDFSVISGAETNFLARLDGLHTQFERWVGFQNGLYRAPQDILVRDSRLLICGLASSTGERDQGLSAWNGVSWESYPSVSEGYEYMYSLGEADGELVVGGTFDVNPGNWGIEERLFAFWSGEEWSVGFSGVEQVVTDFSFAEDTLTAIVKHYSYMMPDWHGELLSCAIRRFPGPSLGASQGPDVKAVVNYNGDIVIGGDFTWFHNCSAPFIERWDGGGWTGAPFHELNARVTDLLVYKGLLIAVGDFTQSGELQLKRIARWNGSRWWAYGDGLDGEVHCITPYLDGLAVGGDFTGHVALWRGGEWHVPGGGVNGRVTRIAADNEKLYLTGEFTEAGGLPSQHIALWEASETPVLLSYFTVETRPAGVLLSWALDPASSLAEFRLEALRDETATALPWREAASGGWEAEDADAGAGPSIYRLYARMESGDWLLLASREHLPSVKVPPQLKAPYPNPCNPSVRIEFTLYGESSLELDLYDAGGHLVRRLGAGVWPVGEHSLVWDGLDEGGRDCASGVYLIRLETRDSSQRRRLVLLR